MKNVCNYQAHLDQSAYILLVNSIIPPDSLIFPGLFPKTHHIVPTFLPFCICSSLSLECQSPPELQANFYLIFKTLLSYHFQETFQGSLPRSASISLNLTHFYIVAHCSTICVHVVHQHQSECLKKQRISIIYNVCHVTVTQHIS